MAIGLVAGIFILVAINVSLWKYGFVHNANNPESVIDHPVMDPRVRKAVLRRLERWRTEGKLSREEYERVLELCEKDWDPV